MFTRRGLRDLAGCSLGAASDSVKLAVRMPRTVLLSALAAVRCFATAGFAEWEIKTPGGNLISRVDPFIATHGTCLRHDGQPEAIYVSHLEWWRYYRGAVTGQAKLGLFLFDEINRTVRYFETREALAAAVRQRRLGAPTSAPLTPKDGWNQVWAPVFERRCRQLANNGPEFQDLDEAAKAGARLLCEEIRKGAASGNR